MDDTKDVLDQIYMYAMTTNKGKVPARPLDIGRISPVLCKYARRLKAEPEPLHLLFERRGYLLVRASP